MEISEVPRITCEELKGLMDTGANVVIIDTRKSSDYNAEHIRRSINIYYSPLEDPMEREMMLSALPVDALLVPYCD